MPDTLETTNFNTQEKIAVIKQMLPETKNRLKEFFKKPKNCSNEDLIKLSTNNIFLSQINDKDIDIYQEDKLTEIREILNKTDNIIIKSMMAL